METFIGTSGYSYPEWKGTFYPPKISSKQMLSYYSSRLCSVEINNTFYRMPRNSVLEGWAAQVGSGFRFALKATRRITHFKKLKEPDDLLAYLTQGLGSLGSTLGPVLFQLPPTMRADLPLLNDFLHRLPSRISPGRDGEQTSGSPTSEPDSKVHSAVEFSSAFEFRHKSWFTDETYGVLARAGAALVGGDQDEEDKIPPLVKTGNFLYLRLRRSDYSSAQLEQWAQRIRDAKVTSVYAYFKHEELGPALAEGLTQLLVS